MLNAFFLVLATYIALVHTLLLWFVVKFVLTKCPDADFPLAQPKVPPRKTPTDGRGSIYVPPSDVETVREHILEKNREAGIDTPIAELRETKNE